jgi:hypothetical protein
VAGVPCTAHGEGGGAAGRGAPAGTAGPRPGRRRRRWRRRAAARAARRRPRPAARPPAGPAARTAGPAARPRPPARTYGRGAAAAGPRTPCRKGQRVRYSDARASGVGRHRGAIMQWRAARVHAAQRHLCLSARGRLSRKRQAAGQYTSRLEYPVDVSGQSQTRPWCVRAGRRRSGAAAPRACLGRQRRRQLCDVRGGRGRAVARRHGGRGHEERLQHTRRPALAHRGRRRAHRRAEAPPAPRRRSGCEPRPLLAGCP